MGRADTPSRHPDTLAVQTPRHPEPPRHPGTPTPQGRCKDASRCKGDARGCKPMQGDARRCKGMQAEKQGGRGKRGGARGKGVASLAKGRKKASISAFVRWSSVVACGLALMLFCAFGSFAPPCPFAPSPFPPPPLLLRLHSPRILLAFPSHSARTIPLHPPCIRLSFLAPPLGCRGVGVSGWLRVSGCLNG